jgi:hypothetical protein
MLTTLPLLDLEGVSPHETSICTARYQPPILHRRAVLMIQTRPTRLQTSLPRVRTVQIASPRLATPA